MLHLLRIDIFPQIRHIDDQEVYDKMLSITNNQRKCRSKAQQISPHTCLKGQYQKCKKGQMLLRMRRKRSAYALLVGMYTGATPMETYCGGYSRNLEENYYVIHYPTSRYTVKGKEIIVSKRDLYSHVHSSIIHSSLGIGTTWVTFNR